MSDWGHAMFAEGSADRTSFYGRNHYTFDGAAPHVSTLSEAFKARIMADVEQGYSYLDYSDFLLLNICNESDVDALVAEYNPADIVDSAGAWDNAYLVAVAWDVLEGLGIYAVVLDDGAIVFDESLIEQVE